MINQYIANLIINSFLVFFTVYVLVEFSRLFFRVKSPRYLSFFYLLPFLKITLDPFFYHFSFWVCKHGIDPVLALKGERAITVGMGAPIPCMQIVFTMQNYTWSIGDLCISFFSSLFGKGMLYSILFLSIIFVSLALYKIFVENIRWKRLGKTVSLDHSRRFYVSDSR